MLSKVKLCSTLLVSPSPLLKFLPTMSPLGREFHRLVDKSMGSETNKCAKYTQKSIGSGYRPDPFDSRQEMFKDGHGVTLYDMHDGERKSLPAVVARFKRLDWGQWIRPRAGRYKKHWKKSRIQLINNEKHVFVMPWHKRRFDRAVTSDIKEIRHIPDDPYKVYNEMSWQHYNSVKTKNMELIKKYGPTNYNFPQHVAHPRKNMHILDHKRKTNYEPPGYHKDIHDGCGVYRPDPARPQDIMPPHYLLEERHESPCSKGWEKKQWRRLRRYEVFSGPLSLCSKLCLPVVGTKTA